MRTFLQFAERIEYVVYGVTALVIFFSIRTFVMARQALRIAVYPLEKEAARNKQSQAIGTIFAVLLLSGGVYIIVNIVAPQVLPEKLQPTPAAVAFSTQPPTPTNVRLLYPTITPTPGLPPPAGGPPTATPGGEASSCDLFGATITSPAANDIVSGQVIVRGQANIIDFQQYKFELRGPGTGGAWVVVGVSTIPVQDGVLGTWDSTSLAAGNYALRLVVSKLDNTFATPCEVPITIASPGGATP